jgi:hypothetical protein
MRAHEILQRFPAENAAEILEYLYEKDKPAYRHCLQILASRRKLRPVVVERKSRPERHLWMISELARKANDDAATEVLQTWLLGSHREMVCSFLDSLGVPHDRGLLDTLPAEPAEQLLREAVDRIFSKHPHPAVIAYLHLFCNMDIADWLTLRKITSEDSRLCLTSQHLNA